MKKRAIKREAKVAELHIERVKLSQLKPHPKNPRKHPKQGTPEWDVLLASLEHDYFDPMVWNTRNKMLVSGHLRKKVLMSMGVTEADVVVVDYDENTHIARMIAANKAIGEDDKFKLTELFGGLAKVEGFNLSLTGFSLAEVSGLVDVDDEVDRDRTEGSDSTERADARIAELLTALGEPTYNVEEGDVYLVDKRIAILGAVNPDQLTEELAKWIAPVKGSPEYKALGKNVSLPSRLAVGPEAFILVDNVLDRWCSGKRWIVVCPTTLSAATLLTVARAANKSSVTITKL